MVEAVYLLEVLREEDRGAWGGLAASPGPRWLGRRGAGEYDLFCGGGEPEGVEWPEKRSSPHISPGLLEYRISEELICMISFKTTCYQGSKAVRSMREIMSTSTTAERQGVSQLPAWP